MESNGVDGVQMGGGGKWVGMGGLVSLLPGPTPDGPTGATTVIFPPVLLFCISCRGTSADFPSAMEGVGGVVYDGSTFKPERWSRITSPCFRVWGEAVGVGAAAASPAVLNVRES